MQPLKGIKVLDLSRLLPGPLASLVLADLGADVDKVEDTSGGDYLRVMPPHSGSGADATSSIFLALNRNKRSAVIDLKKPKGKEALLRLARCYDVVRIPVWVRRGYEHWLFFCSTIRRKNSIVGFAHRYFSLAAWRRNYSTIH